MQSRIADIRKANGEVVAICADPIEENAKVVRKLKLDFPILSDPDLKAVDAYGLRHEKGSIDGGDISRPGVFVIDGEGVVQWRDLAENWRVRVRPETVLEQLAAIP